MYQEDYIKITLLGNKFDTCRILIPELLDWILLVMLHGNNLNLIRQIIIEDVVTCVKLQDIR